GPYELRREQARHALLAAADLEPLGVLLLAPVHRQPDIGERLVERGQVAVALCVGEHAVAVEEERGHDAAARLAGAFPRRPNMRMCGGAVSLTASRTGRKSDGGSCLAGFASRYSRVVSVKTILRAVEMFTLAQPRPIRSWNCSSWRPVPPWSTIGIGCSATIS